MTLSKFIPAFLKQEKSIAVILGLIALAVSIQKFAEGPHLYNNFIIFKTSFFHLIHNKDLYLRYPDEYDDLFLYSPTFALLMAPFAYLPAFFQVLLWCGLISAVTYSAIRSLPFNDKQKHVWLLWLIFFEFITTMQNMQTAAIVASLIILGFCSLEKDKPFKAALFIMLAAFIKIYALAALVLFIMYPKRAKFVLYSILITLVLAALPLLVVSPHQLLVQYQNWYHCTLDVHQSEEGVGRANIAMPLSVMSWLKTWFHVQLPIVWVQLTGTVLLLIPFFKYKLWNVLQYRMLLLASLLIYSMIFNHIAESPSYIVAMFGVAIWFLTEDRTWLTITLMLLTFIFTSLEATDICPDYVRKHYFDPYVIKAVPCIFVWFFLQGILWFKKYQSVQQLTS